MKKLKFIYYFSGYSIVCKGLFGETVKECTKDGR